MPPQPVPASEPGTDPAKRVLPPNPKAAAIVALAFTALLYLVELVDVVLPADLDQSGGIVAREISDLDGVIWAPLLHAGWGHLFSNTVPVLVFAFLAMSAGIGRWVLVTAIIWVLSGVGVWLIAPSGTVTVGASGVAFGWLAFLLVRGIFNRAIGQILVAVVLLGIWSGMLWGLLPGTPNVSWQGHLFGALSGVFAAWVMARMDRSQARKAAGPGSLAG
ncbi:rhomboid family intramembrane serine protease [Amycolatopsis sp. WAC 01375]|uniref:rhomboid family intramembrane serine protease n=1 Tax=unclassified Amycolatopsis TaxID=2618356 RepID=UPI000F7735FE|nr:MULTISPECIES: rhomboid family intramembrane serine protease [unclassified Amycolatopsis]RSM78778.1 rhomboid family intramembrane serine protease [Amycolatopsis sp. WAC 01375]RSN33083.1 rhomboid family intramembrane serine protease [Amycolatopsis sp. WAC 01416]